MTEVAAPPRAPEGPQKLEFRTAYENASENREGGAFLRREGCIPRR